MTGWAIRTATSADAAALAALEGDAFGARSWGAAGVREGIGAPGVSVLLALAKREDGSAQAIGFVMWRDLGGEAEVLTIGVRPPAQRRGAARALLAAVIERARAANSVRLFLEVDASNDAARALYAEAGFQEISRRRSYYRDGSDAVVMRLGL